MVRINVRTLVERGGVVDTPGINQLGKNMRWERVSSRVPWEPSPFLRVECRRAKERVNKWGGRRA